MRHLKEMYLCPILKGRGTKLIKRLEKKKTDPGVYVLTLAMSEKEQIDIYPAYVYQQDAPILTDLPVIGFAAGKSAAMELVRQIAEEADAGGYSGEIRKYILAKEFC